MFEMPPTESGASQYTMYHPSEIELGRAMDAMLAEVRRVAPKRVVLDSLSEVRLLAQQPLRYRRQIMDLKQQLASADCTVLLLDDQGNDFDTHVETIAHGIIALERYSPVYGGTRRRLEVTKLRGVQYRAGYHDFTIERGGLHVYPRLIASEHQPGYQPGRLNTGVAELDALLGGGLEYGTATLLLGPAGTGKSAVATQCAIAAAGGGQRSALFTFDESPPVMFARADSLGMPLKRCVSEGKILVQSIDPAEMSPGQFGHAVRKAAEDTDMRVIVIDSLTGYLNSMPEERHLLNQLHELLAYLGQRGIVSILVATQHGLIGGDGAAHRHRRLGRRCDPAPALRGARERAKRDLGPEETRRRARANLAGVRPRSRRDPDRPAARGLPRRPDRCPRSAGSVTMSLTSERRDLEERVLVFALFGGDAALTRDVLASADIATLVCDDVASLAVEIERGAAAVIVTEEALAPAVLAPLIATLERQPPWSDLPIIVSMTEREYATHLELGTRLNLMALARPVQVRTLVHTVRSARRARRRQYDARDLLLNLQRVTEELRGVEEEMRTVVENLPELAWSAEPNGYISFYNRRWYEYTGKTFEEMVGWGWRSVHDPSVLPEVLERWQGPSTPARRSRWNIRCVAPTARFAGSSRG